MTEECNKKPRLFGSSVSIANNIVIVGSPAIGENGKVYTYFLKSFNKKVSYDPISPVDGHEDDGFGICCKILHDCNKKYYALIGSHRHYEQGVSIGAAYLFFTNNEGETWKQYNQFLPPVALNKSYYGGSVDLINNVAIIGSYGDNTNGLRSGSAHIYVNPSMNNKNGWILAHSLYPKLEIVNNCCDTDYMNNYFGFSVSIEEGYAIVGAPSEKKGKAYIFYSNMLWKKFNEDGSYSHDKHIHVRELSNTRENRFGFSVSCNGTKILVGAPGRDGIAGCSTFFSIEQYITIPDLLLNIPQDEIIYNKEFTTQSLSSRSLFGRSVDFCGNSIIVSGHGRTCENKYIGSAFLFNYSSQGNDICIFPISCLRDKISNELFGHDVSMNNEYVVIGDPSHEIVHIYDLLVLKSNNYLKKWFASDIKLLASDFYSYSINIH